MDQTVNFLAWSSSSTSGASLEMTIRSLSENFGLIRFPNGAKAILSELEKCFAALPAIFPRISTESVELLIRMTICTLQTQTTLDDDLRQIICRGASCLHDKHLAQELLQETAPQTLAQNSEWIDVLQQQNLQHLQPKDGQSYERINFCLENAAKFVALNPEAVPVFHPFLIKPGHSVRAMVLLDTAHSPKTKSAISLLKLDTPSTSTKMVEEIAVSERLFTCDFCQKTFSLRNSFVQHIQRHLKGRLHKCNVCSKAFPSPSHLVIHIRTHTGEKPFSCSFCEKSFSHKNALVVHERTHTGERPYKCNICPKTFISSSALVDHTKTHTGEKPFICSVCHRGFTHSSNLKVHSMTHTGEKPFTCKLCQKSLSRLEHLKRHERIHTGERPYKCNHCTKMFSQSESLVVHTRTHTGEKPFVCSVCHRGFAKSSALKTHFRTHTGEKPFTCDICNKSFSILHNLKTHERIHIGKRPFKCNFCHKMFAQSHHLVVHTRTHTGEKPFVCSVCHRGFAQSSILKRHSRTHTGEKPFTCDVCNKSFAQKGHLNRHKRIHTSKASDLQGSPSGQDGVPIAPSASPSKRPSAEFVCNLPEQLAADMSSPESLPSSSLDMPLEEMCDLSEVTPLEWSNLFLLLQDFDILSY